MEAAQDGDTVTDNRYNVAISALTYGFNCLIYDKKGDRIFDCILSIHEEYINILHVIIAKKVSYLLKLHEIYSLAENEFTIEAKMKTFKIHHYLILYTNSLDSIVFAVKTQWEKTILKIGLEYFIYQAKTFYDRLAEFDPFKADSMMTFLEADKDGGNLLDIQEIMNILLQMKIHKATQEVESDILEINKYLYERERLKRSKGMTDTELNELGFQYLLRYYSIKDDLAEYFSKFCPMFKLKTKSHKHSIVDIVRANEKPVMSASQLSHFFEKVLFEHQNDISCLRLIKQFPVYDGEGKEKMEDQDMLSFNNFCSLISSKRNSIIFEQKKNVFQEMNHPLSDYYIYSDFTLIEKIKFKASTNEINHFERSLKQGCRCLRLSVFEGKNGKPTVKLDMESTISLEEILKIISSKAFQFNSFPLILYIENQCGKIQSDLIANLLIQIFQEKLYTLPNNFQDYIQLPSPSDLCKKILIMSNGSFKLLKVKEKQNSQESIAFAKIVTLTNAHKLDFERKGQICWNFITISSEKFYKYEEVEEENLSNYSKKIMIRCESDQSKGQNVNFDPSIMLRLGVHFIGESFCQITAQNYFLQSKFLLNGGTKGGYLLKPEWMNLKNTKTLYPKNFDTPLYLLDFKVISGQSCLINESSKKSYWLEVYIRGNKREEEVNKKYTSQKLTEGYYTKFDLNCEFTVFCPDLMTIVMNICSEGNEILSSRSIPLAHVRYGLRPIFLLGDHLKEITKSYLFVYCEKKELPKKVNAFLEFK